MTTIEDKISLFSKIIYDKLNEEKEERLRAFNEEALKQLNMEKEKIEELRKNLQRDTLKKANVKANEIIAKEKLNKQREVLALKEKLIKATLEEVRKKLVSYVSTEEYKSYLLNTLESVLSDIEAGSYCIVVLSRDYETYKREIDNFISRQLGKKISIRPSNEDFIGGIILMDVEGRFKIDHSLLKKLNESEELVGIRVMEMLA